MKKVLFLFLLSFLHLLSQAKIITTANIAFNVDEELHTASVISQIGTGVPPYSGDIIIPEMIFDEGVGYTVTSIGNLAFSSCTNLTSITFPQSVTSIGASAFKACNGLTSLTIPQSVTSIGVEAFSFCGNLQTITVENGNTVYDSRDNCNAIIETQTNKLIQGSNSTIIPNSVTSIVDKAFIDIRYLKSVTIPNGVTSIGKSTFLGCKSLTFVSIPQSVTSIGEQAFGGCDNLKEVVCLPPNAPETDITAFQYVTEAILYVPEDSYNRYGETKPWADFDKIESLPLGTIPISGIVYLLVDKVKIAQIVKSAIQVADLVIPETVNYNEKVYSVVGIQSAALKGHPELTSVTIPNTVTSIGDGAFSECGNLTDVSIGTGVTDIGNGAFANCKELTNVYCYAERVPTTNNNAFLNSFIEYANLYVPETAYDDYANTLPWSGFGSISKIKNNAIATGISLPQNRVQSQEDWFDLSGRKLNGMPAKKGIYIYDGRKVLK